MIAHAKCGAIGLAALLLLAVPAVGSARVVEDVITLPVAARDIYGTTHEQPITVTVYRDTDRAKSPFLILNHGRAGSAAGRHNLGRARYTGNSRYFVSIGFAAFVPTRMGYGVSGGHDVEYSGSCARREFVPAFEAGAAQTLAVIDYARAQGFVDPARGVLVGQSVGGAITLTLAAKNLRGIAGAINFAGGAGGDPEKHPEKPCSESELRRVFAGFGEKSRTPMLWLYSENDRYWGRDSPRAWFDAFRKNGGAAEFVLLPAHGADGHGSFTSNPDAWKPVVEKFLGSIGFSN